ncbi:MAG: 2-dehydropantoate 2-reductase [Candidatus Pelagadaptatus aseana]|uniref:2-dehydropantoate 2-reductase n=1 Tax=Candidatus Pelagadaptatus aseana TaxID=3120508 RepID=UPI0039B309A9
MKIVVYGAGSIGCYIGAILSRQGLDVVLLGRERIAKAIDDHGGIGISDYQGRSERIRDVEFSTDAEVLRQADVVLVTLKCTAMPAAADELQTYCKDNSLVVCLQNGVNAEAPLLGKLSGSLIALGIVPFNVIQDSKANFHRATEGTLYLPDVDVLQPVQQAFQDYGVPCERAPDMEAVIWGKLLLNLNNAINALSDQPLKTELSQRGYRRVLAACQEELLMACSSKGIRLAQLTGIKPAQLPKLLKLPDFVFRILAKKMLTIDPQARSSMWEDIQFGRKTEIEFLNGAVVRLAESVGMEAPANATITRMIHGLEAKEIAGGMSADELLSRISEG